MEASGRKARILIVEDESIVALDMRSRLQVMGYEIVALAASGPEAIAAAEKAAPDLVLMDIKLKGDMDGVQAAEHIRRSRDVPVIFVTAFADERTLERAKVTQAFGYILKPFQEREVLISIEMALFKHRMERDLKESRDWLDGTLNAIADAVVALDASGRVVFLNRAAELLLGPAGAPGSADPAALVFEDSPVLSSLAAARGGGRAEAAPEWVFMTTSAGKRPVELTRTSIPAGPGGGGGTVLAIRDIGDVVEAEAARSRLSAIVANSYDAIVSVDPGLRILSWNFGAELMYGYSAAEMVGRQLGFLMPDERDRSHLRDLADVVLNGGEVGRFDAPRKCRSGKIVTASLSLSPIKDAQGRVAEIACIERDVSAEKEYEASLIKAKIVAEEASRAKGEFLSNMSHELRTPLNSIIGMVELSRDLAVSGEQREYLEIARQSADNLLFLINSILDFSKIEAGKMRINAIAFDLVGAVEDCIEGVSVQSYRKGLDLVFVFDPACPSTVIGDPHRFQQILTNILSNAIKFTEKGRIRVDLGARPVGDDETIVAEVSVSDTGIGIPADRIDSIWDEFTQVDGSSTRSFGGTGLGLAIVKSLCELMGGEASVASRVDEGSVFTVRLPFALASGSGSAAAPEPSVQGKLVHLVAGGGEQEQAVAGLLRAWGCEVSVFPDLRAMAASSSASAGRAPHLVVVDEASALPRDPEPALPGVDPMRGALKDRLVVMVGVGGRDEASWRALDGSARFLIKPARRDALLRLFSPAPDAARPEPEKVARLPSPSADEDATAAMAQEATSDPDVQGALELFLKEAEAVGAAPSARLETSAARYRKSLAEIAAEANAKALFKIMLACRKDDAESVAKGLGAVRAALRECENSSTRL